MLPVFDLFRPPAPEPAVAILPESNITPYTCPHFPLPASSFQAQLLVQHPPLLLVIASSIRPPPPHYSCQASSFQAQLLVQHPPLLSVIACLMLAPPTLSLAGLQLPGSAAGAASASFVSNSLPNARAPNTFPCRPPASRLSCWCSIRGASHQATAPCWRCMRRTCPAASLPCCPSLTERQVRKGVRL